MTNDIHYIKRVEISGLWQKFDIFWELNPDVNILAGINGSGKTTILNSIFGLISMRKFQISVEELKKIRLVLDNKKSIEFEKISAEIYLRDYEIQLDYLNDIINIELISTFDSSLKQSEDIIKLSSNSVKTELDWEIYHLQKKYLDYQLNISKRKDLIIENSNNAKVELEKIKYPQNRFLEIMDNLFSGTGKKVNRDKNEISFLLANEEISPFQLSSGEKQMLIILLTVLVQDNKQAILFMDEPEISLHIEWQKKLIQYIRELNPNVQVILATHSPAIIMEGWLDKVFEVSDLIVNKQDA